ncbi:FtsW/RodA/SpoVE family cell cycle protein [Micrococcus terreus]|uniref:FtsW/RodA/SpoVE family cell cycle protein n=1 Tax=Micrococcus terreus TaxID=574650 RepID=UPI0023F8F52A|nr:FtsW/RodA/SpoVE family cell cycle protein [Micrococcus terreus]
MPQVISPARPRRTTELVLLLLALGIGLGAHLLSAIGMDREVTAEYWIQTGVLAIMALLFHLVLRLKARYADPYILPIAVTLNGLGIAMIHRLDLASGDNAADRQLLWTVVAMGAALVVLWFLRDHRLLRRRTYLFLIAAGLLLVLPLIPGLGMEINGARIWINLGVGSFQPGEVAKIMLAIFFAGYLSANRDLILLAGKKVGPVTFPRFRDMAPLVIAWVISMGVLVFQRDLGSAILFFGLFMAMIYLATSRVSWIILGLALVGVGGLIAINTISHVGLRVSAWLNAFDPEVYNRTGGSFQIVQGLFGLASGGLLGTGLGEGRPDIVAYANSDMIVASFGEELGFVGLAAIIMLLLLLVTRMMRAALGTRDTFGKLLAAGLAFTMALQCFVVIGGVTMVIPLTGLTTPFMAAGGSSLLANWIVVALVLLVSQAARRPVVVGPMVNASGTGSGHQDRSEPTSLPAPTTPGGER